jgi:hypothetical protein
MTGGIGHLSIGVHAVFIHGALESLKPRGFSRGACFHFVILFSLAFIVSISFFCYIPAAADDFLAGL